MTSGNIRLGPDPDRILEALKELLRDDPAARQRPAEELEGLEAEEDSLQADEVPEEEPT